MLRLSPPPGERLSGAGEWAVEPDPETLRDRLAPDGAALAALKSTITGDHAAVDVEELLAVAGGARPRVLR